MNRPVVVAVTVIIIYITGIEVIMVITIMDVIVVIAVVVIIITLGIIQITDSLKLYTTVKNNKKVSIKKCGCYPHFFYFCIPPSSYFLSGFMPKCWLFFDALIFSIIGRSVAVRVTKSF